MAMSRRRQIATGVIAGPAVALLICGLGTALLFRDAAMFSRVQMGTGRLASKFRCLILQAHRRTGGTVRRANLRHLQASEQCNP